MPALQAVAESLLHVPKIYELCHLSRRKPPRPAYLMKTKIRPNDRKVNRHIVRDTPPKAATRRTSMIAPGTIKRLIKARLSHNDVASIRSFQVTEPATMARRRRAVPHLPRGGAPPAHPREPAPSRNELAHVIVENQIALAEDVPVRTLKRLQDEGLDRHEAIHAIGMIVMEHLYDLATADPATRNTNPLIYAALEKLTAESWRHAMNDVEAE